MAAIIPRIHSLAAVRCLFLTAIACLVTSRHGSAADPASPFGSEKIHDIHLHFTAQQWSAMAAVETPAPRGPRRDPGPSIREFPWSVTRFEADGLTLSNVAVRFKGNSSFAMSRGDWKRPFRLDFNRGAQGRTWLGAEELSLNNNLNDATQFREALAYHLYREAGVPAPRTAFARVHLTVEGQVSRHFAGVYTLVEMVEADFLESHFRSSKGLLLKPERLRGLEYLGENWEDYTARYEPKSKPREVEAARFIALTRLVANGDDPAFRRDLPKHLDIPAFLRFVAVSAWIANYDSFVGNGHNYYFFQPRDGAPAHFVPWDLNEAFGGHPAAGPRRQQNEFSILRPCAFPNRLIDRVLAQPDWAAAYRQQIQRLQSSVCATNKLLARAEQLARLISPAVQAEDPTAWNSFQRVALGQTHPGPLNLPSDPSPRVFATQRSEDGTLAEWIIARWSNVDAELAGRRSGAVPRMGRGPGPNGPGAVPGPPGRPPFDGPPPRDGRDLPRPRPRPLE